MILQANEGLSTYKLSAAMKTTVPGPKENLEMGGEVLCLLSVETSHSGELPRTSTREH